MGTDKKQNKTQKTSNLCGDMADFTSKKKFRSRLHAIMCNCYVPILSPALAAHKTSPSAKKTQNPNPWAMISELLPVQSTMNNEL